MAVVGGFEPPLLNEASTMYLLHPIRPSANHRVTDFLSAVSFDFLKGYILPENCYGFVDALSLAPYAPSYTLGFVSEPIVRQSFGNHLD